MKIIFGYANAGLGHLRVTDALMDQIPKKYKPYIINPQDDTVRVIHRLTSTWPILRNVAEWFQNGLPQEIFKKIYLNYVYKSSKNIKIAFKMLLKSWKIKPDKILVVCTHFGLANQLAKIKEELETEENIKIFIVVQVTDDSPQSLWYVEGADVTFVPSEKTKQNLIEYGIKKRKKQLNFVVNPYPISRDLGKNLTKEEFIGKQNQLNPNSKVRIDFSVPISGAAVGTGFTKVLIENLSKLSPRFFFHIISREALFTFDFIGSLLKFKNVEINWSDLDRTVVTNYENVFKKNVISIEITKPSEQSFKAILSNKTRGGVIMLFTKPVGRQEYDNLDFLIRHNLIPDNNKQKEIYDAFSQEKNISEEFRNDFLNWRGLRLPNDPKLAAKFIWWCEKEMIFSKMASKENLEISDEFKKELGNEGARDFWNKTLEILKIQKNKVK